MHFVAAVYFEGSVLAIADDGAVYLFNPRERYWMLLAGGPTK